MTGLQQIVRRALKREVFAYDDILATDFMAKKCLSVSTS